MDESQDISLRRSIDDASDGARGGIPSSAPRLTIDALQQSIRFHPIVGSVWLKEIRKLTSAADHKSVDVWMIIILFGFPSLEEKVMQMVKSKIHSSEMAHAGSFVEGAQGASREVSHAIDACCVVSGSFDVVAF